MSDHRGDLEKAAHADETSLVRAEYPKEVGYVGSYPYGYDDAAGGDGFHLRKLWNPIRKHLLLVIIIPIIVTAVLTVEVYRPKPIYRSSTLIEIKKEGWVLVKSSNSIFEDESEVALSSITLKTNMLLLKSRPVLQNAIAKLPLDEMPNFFDITKKKKSRWETVKTFWDGINGTNENQYTQVAPARQTPEVGQVKTQPLEEEEKPEKTAEEKARLLPFVRVLEDNLSIEPIRDTRALSVSFSHTDPTIAAAVANAIAKAFVKHSFESKTTKFDNAKDWLERTTQELRVKLQRAEQTLENYSRDHNIFAPDGKESFATNNVARLYDQAMRAETDRVLKESLYEEVKAGRTTQLPEAFSDQKMKELQARLDQLAVEASQLDVALGRRHPRVIDLRQQMATIQSQLGASRKALEDKLLADYNKALRDEESLKAALERAKAEAVEHNQAAIQYGILKQDVDTAKALYTEFLQKTNQANIELAQQPSNVRIIEPAEIPGEPVASNSHLAILMGLLLSLSGSVGLAVFLEYLSRTIKSVEDVDRYIQLPAIGVIPEIKSQNSSRRSLGKGEKTRLIAGNGKSPLGLIPSKSDYMLVLDDQSSAAEAYRGVSASVLLGSGSAPPKTILVTSGLPGEGKTTTVINTAISLSQLGASVLVIDCDLRNPSSHKAFGVDSSPGLSTYLTNDVEIGQLIKPLQLPNLAILPSGPVHHNPAKLIISQKMKDLLQLLGKRYDHILIDSPPLIGITDPIILSTLVDGVIVVVHGGKSTREMARRTRQELWNIGANIFGVVLNNISYRDYSYYQPNYRDADIEV